MKKHNKFPRKGEGLDGNSVQSPHSKIAGQLTWCNNNCIISMQGFVWVVFFVKAKQAFCYPALLTVDGWFHFFISKGLGKWQFTSIPLTEARICLYNLRMYGHAPLLMGLYNNYSRYYKVRRRLYVNEPFDKLNLSGKNILKNGPGKVWRLGVMLRNMTWSHRWSKRNMGHLWRNMRVCTGKI